jgi:hypothetical protein
MITGWMCVQHTCEISLWTLKASRWLSFIERERICGWDGYRRATKTW